MKRAILLRCVLALAGVVAAVLLGLVLYYGSLRLAIARLSGERFVISPAAVDLGECESRTEHDVEFTVTNFTAHEIRIVGGEQSCSCVALGDLPLEVPPGESANISVRFFVAGEREFSRSLILYIDDEEVLKSVAARVTARIKHTEKKSS